MKRAKNLVTIVTIASLTLGCAVTVFGEDAPAAAAPAAEVAAEVAPVAEEAAPAEAVVEAAAPVEEAVPAVTFEDLKVADKPLYSDQTSILGVYPVIEGMADLNAKIESTVVKDFYMYSQDQEGVIDSTTYKIGYTVENKGQYAKVSISVAKVEKTMGLKAANIDLNYYINKDGFVEMTAEAYEAAIAEPVAPEVPEVVAPAEPAEVELYGIRAYSELFGYTLEWNGEEKSVTVLYDEKAFTVIVVDVNAYTVGGEVVELESAPVLKDGSVLVPASFFVKVLGGTATVGEDGKVVLAPAAKAPIAEAPAAEAPAAEVAEAPAAEAPAADAAVEAPAAEVPAA